MNATFLFNSDLRALRRVRAGNRDQQSDAGFLFHEGAQALADRLSFISRAFTHPVFHGLDFGALQAAMPHLTPVAQIAGEREVWSLARESCDLIISNLQLHWVNDLPGLLVQIRRCLRADGFFSACLVGGESLFELRAAIGEAETALGMASRPRISPMIDLHTSAGLMQRAGFALPVVDHEVLSVRYQNPLKLLKDLRAMGQSNAIAGQGRMIDPKGFWPLVCEIYGQLFPHRTGGVTATFDLIFLSGWAPASSQQQPLKPGSARMDLEEGLKNV